MGGVKDAGEAAPATMSESEFLIRSLHAITTDQAAGFDDHVRRLLELGCRRFELEFGILARVEGNVYTVMGAVAPEGIDLKAGDTFELGNTYCSVVLAANGPVGFAHVGHSEMHTHPAYKLFQLESYVGTPVRVGGEVYGTLNFSSPYPKPRQFDPSDIDTLQLMASWIGREIHRERTEAHIREANSKLEHTKRAALVGELVGSLRHELNNPLTVALANLELIEAGGEIRDVIADVRSALGRMRDVMRELSRLVRDPSAPRTSVDLAAYVRRMVEDARWRHRVTTDLKPARVHVVEPRLFQALHNVLLAHLYGGANGHGAAGTPVHVRCGPSRGRAEVVVESGCVRPLAAVRTDILATLRGEAPLSEVPLSLAEHLVVELGGELVNTLSESGLRTVVRLPPCELGRCPHPKPAC